MFADRNSQQQEELDTRGSFITVYLRCMKLIDVICLIPTYVHTHTHTYTHAHTHTRTHIYTYYIHTNTALRA